MNYKHTNATQPSDILARSGAQSFQQPLFADGHSPAHQRTVTLDALVLSSMDTRFAAWR